MTRRRNATSAVPTAAERRKFGRLRRKILSRARQGDWAPAKNRDALGLLLRACRRRFQAILPIKWGRMAASPFGFFRGAAPLMAFDLAKWPTTGLVVQMCGDAHVGNLGAFAAPDGHLVFDLNDFDESMLGPFEWDLKRLSASLVLAGRMARETDAGCGDAVRAFVAEYRTAMALFADMSPFELAKYEIRRRSQVRLVRDVLAKAERATRSHLMEKLTERTDGIRRFRLAPPLLTAVSGREARRVVDALASYRDTLVADRQLLFDAYHPQPRSVCFRVSGTGGVALRNYVVLCLGRDSDDAIFLQLKEAQEPCAAPYLRDAAAFDHQGRRVAEAQHRMQSTSDPLLGWTTIAGRDFVVRQLADHKARIDTGELRGETLEEYAFVCGQTLAKGHARTGDPLALQAYCGRSDNLDRSLAQFAIAYADQTERDFEQWQRAIRDGEIKAILGV